MSYEEVWDMNVYLFFNYLNFDIEYRKWEAQEIQKWKNTH